MDTVTLQTYEILGHAYTSYLPPFVTTGLSTRRSAEMEARGYNEVTIETFGNVWTRTEPPDEQPVRAGE